jgi:hypothetical protein
MFSLHERTQRLVCRTLFLAICAAPTLLTLGWVLYFHLPWQESDWQRTLENTLHVRANVTGVAAPRPGQRSFSTLRFTSLDTSHALGEFRQFNIIAADALTADLATIQWSRLPELSRVVQVWLTGDEFRTTRWIIKSAQLVRSAGSGCEFRNLRVESSVSTSGTRQILLQVELNQGRRVRLLIERDMAGKLYTSLDTQQAVVPAWLMAQVIPSAGRWGDANLSGIVRLEQDDAHILGTFRGTVDSIDTQDWIGTDHLQTQAKLDFEMLRWQDGRIQSAEGQLETTEGRVHHKLLQALQERLFCTIASELTDKVAFHPFQRAACNFQMNEQGLTVTGECSSAGTSQGYLMVADGKPLVTQPGYSNLPVAQLIQVFCPLEKAWLPATREATDMADKLPLPKGTSIAEEQRRAEPIKR